MQYKILLVEDDAPIALEEAQLLEKYGYSVETTHKGEYAINKVKEDDTISLILMDIELSGELDGTEAAGEILSVRELPIVFLTGHTEAEFVSKVEEITGYGIVHKKSGELVMVQAVNMALKLFQAHRKVEEKELDAQAVIDNIDSAIIRFNNRGEIIFFSKGAEKIFGYRADEILGRTPIGLLNPYYDSEGNNHEDFIQNVFSNPESYSYQENENITKDGSRLWMAWRNKTVYDKDGNIKYIQTIGNDITKKKEYERLVEERTRYVESILHASPNAMLTLDSENRVSDCNSETESLFHYTREEMIGKDIDHLVTHKDKEIYNEAVSFSQKTFSLEEVPPTESIRYTKEGRPLNLLVAGSPILIDNTYRGTVVTYTAITELKEKEEEVNTLLEEKNRLLREVHHRIKNHMNTISAILTLRNSYNEDSRASEILTEVQNKIQLMQNIYQTLYTGEDISTIDLKDFFEQLLYDIGSTYIRSQSIRIDKYIENIKLTSKQSLPIGIIITELITNSLKYAFQNGEEGTITVSIRKTEKNMLQIAVSDNGKRISDDIIENKSYGFGLTLVEGYCHQFNGDMAIENTDGTSVTVTMALEHGETGS